MATETYGIPIVQARKLGQFLGEVSLTLRQGSASVTCSRLKATTDLPADQDFERTQVKPLIRQVRPLFSRKLGHVPDHPDFSTEAVRNDFAAGELALTNFITCNSFLREAAAAWEEYATRHLKLPIVNVREWPRIDTDYFLRDEIITHIRGYGGLTEAAGARRDGRLKFVCEPTSLSFLGHESRQPQKEVSLFHCPISSGPAFELLPPPREQSPPPAERLAYRRSTSLDLFHLCANLQIE